MSTRLWATGSPRRPRWPRERPPRACRCLRRGHLVGYLAPYLAGILDQRGEDPGRARVRGVLALDDGDLIAAVAGSSADAARRFVADFDPDVGTGAARAGRHHRDLPPLRALSPAAERPRRRPRGDLRHRHAGPASDRAVRAVRRRGGCPARLSLRAGRWHMSSGGGSARRASPWSAAWRWGSTPRRIAAASTPRAPPSRFSPAAPTCPIRGAIAASTTACVRTGSCSPSCRLESGRSGGAFPLATGSWPA